MSLLVILAILGSVGHNSVQNWRFTDRLRKWGEIKFISSNADLLTLENLLQDIRKCSSLSINAEAEGLCPEHGELLAELGGVQY